MEFQEHVVQAERVMSAATVAVAGYPEFKMESNHRGEEEPVLEAVPLLVPVQIPISPVESPPPNVPPPRNRRKGKYQECRKNHGVGMGGLVLDGCNEFLPAGKEGTLEGLKCAACDCHRNFHRKETNQFPDQNQQPQGQEGGHYLVPYHLHHPAPTPPAPQPFAAYYHAPTGYLHVAGQPHATSALPATSGGGTLSPGAMVEDQEDVSDPSSGPLVGGSSSNSNRKRFRTRFSQEQKDKMLSFAEKLGWKIQKHDESVVQQFCSETGVQRNVLKVWMHNNKHTLGKKP